jgi:hypothetical protein
LRRNSAAVAKIACTIDDRPEGNRGNHSCQLSVDFHYHLPEQFEETNQ